MTKSLAIVPLALALTACLGGGGEKPMILPAAVEGTANETKWVDLAREEQELREEVADARDDVQSAINKLDDAEGDLRKAEGELVEAQRAWSVYEGTPVPTGDSETIAAETKRRSEAAKNLSEAEEEVAEERGDVADARDRLAGARDTLAALETRLEQTRQERRRLEGY
ncbi:hypothetical protein [Sphingomicrobium sediminis]|uniref:Uncharacterized protein n=1 Tax=Sphingomicrobium sediminis TaxID=2950949 RepID=A0A9X2EGH5_9SPHN|nr:hypothetical protein [Sphingomicrobium sediminis]MCM8557595.1 hypothetical protein [Sphingomicrobium sediminis]